MSDILDLSMEAIIDETPSPERPYSRKENLTFAVMILSTVLFGTMSMGWVAMTGPI